MEVNLVGGEGKVSQALVLVWEKVRMGDRGAFIKLNEVLYGCYIEYLSVGVGVGYEVSQTIKNL